MVKPQHTVMDFGGGSDVLSIFVARAVAKRVIGVDCSVVIQTAKTIARDNGISKIDFYQDDHESLSVKDKVDILLSEGMGQFNVKISLCMPKHKTCSIIALKRWFQTMA